MFYGNTGRLMNVYSKVFDNVLVYADISLSHCHKNKRSQKIFFSFIYK